MKMRIMKDNIWRRERKDIWRGENILSYEERRKRE